MKKIKELIKNPYMIAVFSNILASGATFIYSIYTRNQILPEEYGIYTKANMIAQYLNYLQLGALSSYSRDYPQILGSNDKEGGKRLTNVIFTYILSVYVLVALTGSVLLCVFRYSEIIEERFFVFLIADIWLTLFSVISTFMANKSKSEKKYNKASISHIVAQVALLIVGIFSIKQFGMYGMIVAGAISALLGLLFYTKDFLYYRFAFRLSIILDSIKSGLPLLVMSFIWTVMNSIDKWVILAYWNDAELGKYSIALTAFSTILLVPQSIGQIFYVKMSREYGENKDGELLFERACQFSKTVNIIACIVSICSLYFLPSAVEIFLPKYVEGVPAAQVMCIGVLMYSMSLLFSNVLNIQKKNKKLMFLCLLVCGLNTVFSFGLVFIMRKLIYVAVGTAVSYFLYSIIVILSVRGQSKSVIQVLQKSGILSTVCIVALAIVFYFLIDYTVIAFILSFGVAIAQLMGQFISKRRGENDR